MEQGHAAEGPQDECVLAAIADALDFAFFEVRATIQGLARAQQANIRGNWPALVLAEIEFHFFAHDQEPPTDFIGLDRARMNENVTGLTFQEEVAEFCSFANSNHFLDQGCAAGLPQLTVV